MMKTLTAALFAAALSGASFAACTDEAGAQAQLDRFATDMTDAAEAGKLDEAALRDIQTELNTLMAELSADDFASFCKGLDSLRADFGF